MQLWVDSAVGKQCWLLHSSDELAVIVVFILTQGRLNEQLRIVLEENVSLQKQLIKLERQYLKSMMKSSPITQIKGGCKRLRETRDWIFSCFPYKLSHCAHLEAQTEVEELRKEIEGLREKVQEAEKVKELSNMLQESRR